jgi:hypothetical protein
MVLKHAPHERQKSFPPAFGERSAIAQPPGEVTGRAWWDPVGATSAGHCSFQLTANH